MSIKYTVSKQQMKKPLNSQSFIISTFRPTFPLRKKAFTRQCFYKKHENGIKKCYLKKITKMAKICMTNKSI